jgi:hypothetical protein
MLGHQLVGLGAETLGLCRERRVRGRVVGARSAGDQRLQGRPEAIGQGTQIVVRVEVAPAAG